MPTSVLSTQWIWTPIVGWVLLSGNTSAALAQTSEVPPTVQGIGPQTGAPMIGSVGAMGSGVTAAGATTEGTAPIGGEVKPATTTSLPAGPTTVLPAVTPQAGIGSSAAGVNANMLTGGTGGANTNEVTGLPSYSTTIVNAPFGASIPVEQPIGGTGPVTGGSEELGISVGTFRLYPQIETNVGFDSNVFAQSASLGTVGSVYTTIAPTLDLRSDWSNHALHIQAGGIAGFYGSAPSQNYRNYTLQADGKIDIQTDFYATWSAAFKQTTEALGTPNVAFAQSPTVVNSVPISLNLYQRFNRLSYQLKASMTRYTFYDNSTILVNGLPATSRDRTEYEESLRIGYEISDDVTVFVQPGLNQRRYLNAVNSVDQDRDSNGQLVNVGATWSTSSSTKLEATVGYQNQAYQTLGGATSAFTFGLTGSWNGYAPLTLRPSIQRAISETALTTYKNYVSTTYALDFNYLIHDAWTAVGGISLITADYTPIDGSGAAPRTDSIYRGQIGLLYALRPQVQIGPFIEYTNGVSTDPTTGPGYDREIFSVRLIAKR